MARSRRTRTNYSPQSRERILAAANKEGLTADDVHKRFGVIPVTYYSWRKKAGVTRPRGSGIARAPGGTRLIDDGVRGQVQARIRAIVPALVRSEVSGYLEQVLGSGRVRSRPVKS